MPWAAGCRPALALGLTAVSLMALPAALAAIPGPGCRLRALRLAGCDQWAVLRDGAEAVVLVDAASRVFPAVAFCRLTLRGRQLDWWVPRYALPEDEFRRLKVALRCARSGQAGPAC